MREIIAMDELVKSIESNQAVLSPHLLCASSDSGCGSVIELMLQVPEYAVLFVAPYGCSRHISVYPCELTGRLYKLTFSEVDVVVGRQTELVEQAVDQIIQDQPDVKGIVICASCIDRLLATDYDYLQESLQQRYQIPIYMEWMNPILAKCHPHEENLPHMMKWMHPETVQVDKKIVITLGRLHRYAETSEMRKLLKNEGIDEIIHLTDCKTLEDFNRMGHAVLTLVMYPFGERAAKYLEETYGIPYVVCTPTYDPDEIHAYYEEIGEKLGVEIDDSYYYEKIKNEIKEALEQTSEKTFAVGEIISSTRNAFHNARTLIKDGFNVRYIFAGPDTGGKEEDIYWLKEHSPETKLVALTDPAALNLMENPLEVDYAVGILEDWYAKAKHTKWINFDEEPQNGDYDSIHRLLVEMGVYHE